MGDDISQIMLNLEQFIEITQFNESQVVFHNQKI